MCGANLQNTFCLIGPSLTNAGLPVANVSNVAPIEMKTDAIFVITRSNISSLHVLDPTLYWKTKLTSTPSI